MKKVIIIVTLLINYISAFCLNDEILTPPKSKILILPFMNKNKIAEYDYLSDIIMETIRGELVETDKYEFTNFSMTDKKLKKRFNKNEDFTNLKTAKYIARQLNADVVITGQYIIIEKKILILIHIIDIFNDELVAIIKAEGNTGVNIFNVINEAVSDMVEKINEKLPEIEKKKYDKVMEKNLKLIITPMKSKGIAYIICGSSLFLVGIPFICLYPYYYDQYLKKESTDNTMGIAYLILGCSISSLGAILTIIGIPLLLVNIKKNISMEINLNNDRYVNSRLCFLIRIRM